MRKLMRALLCIFFLPLLGLFLLLINIIQTFSLVLLPFSGSAFRALNRFVARTWFDSLAFTLQKILRVCFLVSGDSLPKGENVFLISNHQSMADIPTLLSVAGPSGRTGDLKWFVKDVLKWVPGVGWGMLFLDCIFVKRNWNADKEHVQATFARLRENKTPFWVVSFVEGTRLTPAKLRRSESNEIKAGVPVMRNVMSPRTKGFDATLEGLGPLNQAVYDITIAYENHPQGQAPGLMALFFSVEKVHIHARRYPAHQLPQNSADRATWIQERFREKDRRLDQFRKTGVLA